MLPYFHLNQASTVHYMAEREGDQSHPPDLFTLQASDASHPFRPCPILFSNLQDRCHIQHHPSKQQANEPFLITGASNRLASNTLMDDDDGVDHNLKLSLCDHYVKEERAHAPSCKWMPSKLPITGKTMSSESDRDAVTHARPTAVQVPVDRSQQQSMRDFGASDDSNPPCGNNIVRVCSDCRTTKTPLWRSGPCGPKTLCNACGIRQRKARRAMAAAAVNSGLLPPHRELTPAKMRKYQKKLDAMPFKKRCKPLDAASSTTTAQAKLRLEDHVTLSLSTSSTFDRVLPQDERDAAILLMGLSCGIIRS